MITPFMKRIFTLLFFIPLAIMLIAGCVKKAPDEAAKAIYPSGYFAGLFSVVHHSTRTQKNDTTSCNLTLTLDPVLKAFTVGGDTSVVHAGSRGSYSLDAFYLAFTDNTLATADGKKVHLTGAYSYAYDGTVFRMEYVQDTMKVIYNMKAK